MSCHPRLSRIGFEEQVGKSRKTSQNEKEIVAQEEEEEEELNKEDA